MVKVVGCCGNKVSYTLHAQQHSTNGLIELFIFCLRAQWYIGSRTYYIGTSKYECVSVVSIQSRCMPLDTLPTDQLQVVYQPISMYIKTVVITILFNRNVLVYALFLKKWANTGLFFVYIWSFQTNIITIFTTIIC